MLEDLCDVTGAVTRVGVLSGLTMAVMQKRPGERPAAALSATAGVPADASALGRAILAFSPPSTVDVVIKDRTFTSTTSTAAEQFRGSLAATRLTRIAMSNGELERGGVWIALPVFGVGDDVVAAIGLRLRKPPNDMLIMAPILKIAACSLSRELAQPVPPQLRPLEAVGVTDAAR